MLRRLALLLAAVSGVKEHDFRKCRDTPFCGRHRDPPATAEPFRVGSVTFVPAEGATRTNECSGLTATLVAPDATRAQLPLVLSLSVLETGAVRLLIDEDSSISPSELHRADPSVTKPAEWDEDMDGPWDAPMLKLVDRLRELKLTPDGDTPFMAKVSASDVHAGGLEDDPLADDDEPPLSLVELLEHMWPRHLL